MDPGAARRHPVPPVALAPPGPRSAARRPGAILTPASRARSPSDPPTGLPPPIAAQPEDSKPVQGDAAVWYGDTFLAWGVDRAGEGRTFWFEPLSR